MSKTIYVANLPEDTEEQEINDLFAQYGDVHSIKLIVDNETDKLLGFGFIEMDEAAADQAIRSLKEYDFKGNKLQVNQARGRSSDR